MSSHQQPDVGLRAHGRALLAMSLVSLASFQYGVDFGIIGGLQAMVPFLEVFGAPDDAASTAGVGWNLSPTRQQLISSLMIVGAFVASGAAGLTSRAGWCGGRKAHLWVACALSVLAVALMQTTRRIGVLYAARVLIGLANGLLMTHSQLYIQEVLPGKYRGLGISVFTYWVAFGSLIGTIVDNAGSQLPTRAAYVIPLGIVYIVPGLLCVGLFLIPESPRWLLAQRGDRAAAERALRWLRPNGWSVEAELADMETALAAETARTRAGGGDGDGDVGFVDLFFRDPVDRRRSVLAVLALTTQAASGVMFVISYGTYFFEMARVGDAFGNACILGGAGVAALLANSALVTRFGRRRAALLAGLGVCGLAQLVIAVVYTVRPGSAAAGKALVGLSVLYVVGYNALVSPYAWLSGGELPSQRLRSYTFGVATAVGFAAAWLTTFTAPYFINPDALDWGPKYGYIWAPSCLVAMAWVYFYLPEVQGRTLEEIDEMFEARVPARKFRAYRCAGAGHRDGADLEGKREQEDKDEAEADVVHEEGK